MEQRWSLGNPHSPCHLLKIAWIAECQGNPVMRSYFQPSVGLGGDEGFFFFFFNHFICLYFIFCPPSQSLLYEPPPFPLPFTSKRELPPHSLTSFTSKRVLPPPLPPPISNIPLLWSFKPLQNQATRLFFENWGNCRIVFSFFSPPPK